MCEGIGKKRGGRKEEDKRQRIRNGKDEEKMKRKGP